MATSRPGLNRLSEEVFVDVRAVDLRVARGAVLESRRRQVMKTRRTRNSFTERARVGMALKTELPHFISFEHLGTVRSVRGVAGGAAFDFQRRVLEDERPLLVGVAFDTGCVSAGVEPGLLLLESAMWVVTIRAVHRAFQNPVMERLRELRLRFVMTGEAQLRLSLYKHLDRGQIG